MGRFAIMAVLTLLFVLGIVGYSLNRRIVDATSNSAGYYSQNVARNIAESGAEVYIYKLWKDSTMIGTFTIPSIMQGCDTITISKKNSSSRDTLIMTSVAHYGSASVAVTNQLYAVNVSINIDSIYGAAAMSSGKYAKVVINGGSGNGNAAYIDGIDTDPNGKPHVPADTVAGLAVNTTSPEGAVTISVPSSS